MGLPYENATTGKAALEDIRKILQGFGATSFGVLEDFKGGVIVEFRWRKQHVSLQTSAEGYAAAWLRAHPYTRRTRGTEAAYRQRALKQGTIAVYSILRDWIKGQVTAVEVGMLTFESAFLAQIILPGGKTVLEQIEETKLLEHSK